MRRPALYARSHGVRLPEPLPGEEIASSLSPAATEAPGSGRWQRRAVLASLLLAFAAIVGTALSWPRHAERAFTQKDIDAAVVHALQTTALPSQAARAAAIIAPSVVRVVGYGADLPTPTVPIPRSGKKSGRAQPPAEPREEADSEGEKPGSVERGIGTGVVITDKGVILTNLHVVAGADKIKVTFYDGMEADAVVTGTQPDDDLAVLQAQLLPDDLIPATMRSTADLNPGDQVAAVGFPFGIGPSVSAGVVSGLKRSFRSPEGKQALKNLIQFDAAANPGNSGGPLVNMEGEVLGIVTAILNPTHQRTFIGIGFAVPIENAAAAAGTPPF